MGTAYREASLTNAYTKIQAPNMRSTLTLLPIFKKGPCGRSRKAAARGLVLGDSGEAICRSAMHTPINAPIAECQHPTSREWQCRALRWQDVYPVCQIVRTDRHVQMLT